MYNRSYYSTDTYCVLVVTIVGAYIRSHIRTMYTHSRLFSLHSSCVASKSTSCQYGEGGQHRTAPLRTALHRHGLCSAPLTLPSMTWHCRRGYLAWKGQGRWIPRWVLQYLPVAFIHVRSGPMAIWQNEAGKETKRKRKRKGK
ncbi:hypothetical protein LZ31DRAFT_337735 [Colletotrichum somersetense]|nr:hypothetical protein LZ31DRAFT_337735 [Colletotrichum somersetense]